MNSVIKNHKIEDHVMGLKPWLWNRSSEGWIPWFSTVYRWGCTCSRLAWTSLECMLSWQGDFCSELICCMPSRVQVCHASPCTLSKCRAAMLTLLVLLPLSSDGCLDGGKTSWTSQPCHHPTSCCQWLWGKGFWQTKTLHRGVGGQVSHFWTWLGNQQSKQWLALLLIWWQQGCQFHPIAWPHAWLHAVLLWWSTRGGHVCMLWCAWWHSPLVSQWWWQQCRCLHQNDGLKAQDGSWVHQMVY